MDVSTDSTVQPANMYDYINGIASNPSAFIIIVVVFAVFVVLFLSLGGSSGDRQGTPSAEYQQGTSIFGILMIGVLVVAIVLGGLNYYYGSNMVVSLKNLFTGKPTIDVTVDQTQGASSILAMPTPSIPTPTYNGDQVFNIPGNYYGYEDAKSICTAYGARLASYDEVENAYTNGAEWCNYGWSDGQMALFPTQKSTFDNLQTIKGHEHDCGRQGVNGGYMANPKLQFGVNCFGQKPKITSEEETIMENTTPYPKTAQDILLDKRVEYWKTKLNDILVSPFNYNTWSRF